jgi:hypothetical protein
MVIAEAEYLPASTQSSRSGDLADLPATYSIPWIATLAIAILRGIFQPSSQALE